MALTAAYLIITPAGPRIGGTGDSHVASNIDATTTAFHLKKDRYVIVAVGSTFGTATLEILGPAATYLTAATAVAANGMTGPFDLPDGEYRWLIA